MLRFCGTPVEKHCHKQCHFASYRRLTKLCLWACTHSRSISFFSWCLTQWGVGDCGQPVRVWYQSQQTDDSAVNARHSAVLDLPFEYSIENVLISTDSSISSGRSVNFYNKHITWTFDINKSINMCSWRPSLLRECCWFQPSSKGVTLTDSKMKYVKNTQSELTSSPQSSTLPVVKKKITALE